MPFAFASLCCIIFIFRELICLQTVSSIVSIEWLCSRELQEERASFRLPAIVYLMSNVIAKHPGNSRAPLIAIDGNTQMICKGGRKFPWKGIAKLLVAQGSSTFGITESASKRFFCSFFQRLPSRELTENHPGHSFAYASQCSGMQSLDGYSLSSTINPPKETLLKRLSLSRMATISTIISAIDDAINFSGNAILSFVYRLHSATDLRELDLIWPNHNKQFQRKSLLLLLLFHYSAKESVCQDGIFGQKMFFFLVILILFYPNEHSPYQSSIADTLWQKIPSRNFPALLLS